jgi:hypothetical protein
MGVANACAWSVQPLNGTYTADTGPWTFKEMQNGNGYYKVYVTKATSTSASADLVVNMTVDATATLYDLNTNAATSLPLTAFQASAANNVWIPVGIISNTTPNPIVTFTWASGTLSSTVRWYMDAVRFEFLGDPCSGVSPQAGITGPLGAGQTFVNVTGVAAGATNVTVYANNSQIGATNYAAGFAAGTLKVVTSALNKGDGITATQIKPSGANACASTAAPAVVAGGGPNSDITVFLACYQTPAATGPVGANGSAVGNPYAIGASYVSFGSPPQGGKAVAAQPCWQEVTFQNRIEDAVDLNSGGHVTNTDAFCSFAGLVINQVADSGPYDIYVDSIINGTTVIEDFEGYATGTTNTFVAPGVSTTPNPALAYLPPNSSLTSTNHAFDGTNSCRIQWQWSTTSGRWSEFLASGAYGGKKYPQLDTSKPITIRFLVLPVGQTVSHKFNGTVGTITNTPPAYTSSGSVYNSTTLSVPVTGSGPYTYQWYLNDTPYNDQFTPTYKDDYLSTTATTNIYKVNVSDGTCTETRTLAVIVKDPLPVITQQPASSLVNVGNPAPMTVTADSPAPSGLPLSYQWELITATATNAISGATTSALGDAIANAQGIDSGYYDVIVANSFGSVTSSVVSLQVVGADVVLGTGTGRRGDYYNDVSYTENQPLPGVAFPGNPVLTRVDSTINYIWGNGSPDPAINADYFAARWYGEVQVPIAGSYTFTARSDDGERVWVDGNLIVDDWIIHGARDASGTITLTTGNHKILMEFFERLVAASAQLSWSNASGTISESFVPVQQLFPGASYTKPTIVLTPPVGGLPPIALAAGVTTNDALVAYVAFSTNGVLLATNSTPPYTYSWAGAAPGTYAVSAQVYYNASANGTLPSSVALSGTNSVTVLAPTAPHIDSIVAGPGTPPPYYDIHYSGGVGHNFVIWSSPTANAPMASWTRGAMNGPAGSGVFSVAGGPNAGFYRISSE